MSKLSKFNKIEKKLLRELEVVKKHENIIKEDLSNKKEFFLNEIINDGDELLEEINEKNKIQNLKKKKLIKYIIKKEDYSEFYLNKLHYFNIVKIYEEVKYKNRSIFKKFLDFIFTSQSH